MIGQVKEFRIGEEMIHMQWRGWLGPKPTEAEFVRDLVRDRPEAAAWVYDPTARTLSQSGNVLSLVNMYFSAPPGRSPVRYSP
jgi:hypothetical protein